MSKNTSKVAQKVEELKDALKEYNYVEDVDVTIHIHESNNYVDTVEKAVEIVDDVFGEHLTRRLDDVCIVVSNNIRQHDYPFELNIFLPLTDHNKELAMDEEFSEVVEEVNGDVKTSMS